VDEQVTLGFPTAEWCAFQQAKTLGASVRKGEHGTPVWYIAPRVVPQGAVGGDDDDPSSRGLTFKQFTVFNRAQCDDLPVLVVNEPLTALARLANVEAYSASIGANVHYGGDAAHFAPGSDSIACPPLDRFVDAAAFYGTVLHEHIHWTGHERRLARTFGKRFGDDAYAAEELVAELGAAFLTAQLLIAGTLRHVEYLGHSAQALRAEPKALLTASPAATKAVVFFDSKVGLAPPVEFVDTA